LIGRKGRVAIHELLEVDETMKQAIMNRESFAKLREIAMQNKTIFLLGDGLLKVKQGLTTTEEVLRVIAE
jgi:type IV pilus assembly protein PilB